MAKSIKGHIHQHMNSRHSVFLPPELHAWARGKETITINFGQRQVTARPRRGHRPGHLYISANVWRKLNIPYETNVHLRWGEDQLSVGPLVGLLLAGYPGWNSTSGLPKSLDWINQFLLASFDVPLYYFIFFPQDISYATREVLGRFLIFQNGRWEWQRHRVPWPNVVYNRVPNRVLEQSPPVVRAKNIMKQSGVQIFNPDFFNKWTMHDQIRHDPRIKDYIPETIFNPDLDQIAHMADRYRMVYLKPASGSLGLGIAQLIHRPHKGYYVRYRRGTQNKLYRFKNISTAIRHFMQYKSSKSYIAQQGIPLMSWNGRQIDFRVHTNKNSNGEWEVTAIAAKLAGRGSVTTHVRSGGKVLSPHEAIGYCFPSERRRAILDELKQAATILSQVIDDHTKGWVGELGFDLGIDQKGKPWMFEANSKPGRSVFQHHSQKESGRLTRQKVLEYALYLAGFTGRK